MINRTLGNEIRFSPEMENRIYELLDIRLKDFLNEQERKRVSEKPIRQGHAGRSIELAIHLLAAAIWYFGVMPAVDYALAPGNKAERNISIEQPILPGR
ncbi:MAG: hypothetical protein K8F90_13005 [Hyphomicrobiales bacterium]|nr:hypothetical protein [Hyphomicrobiales bacterium]